MNMPNKPAAWKSRIVGHDRVDPKTLTANPLNHRTHPDYQKQVVRDSIAELGFVRSVTVNKTTGRIIDGHERVEEALATEQPTIDVEWVELSESEERKALAILDASAGLAEVDHEQLEKLLAGLETDSDSIQKMLDELAATKIDLPAEIVEDEVPEPPVDPITKPGDLWLLGEHRLLCGDSTKAEDVKRLLGDRKPFLMVTDPPYGVEHDPGWREKAGVSTYGPQAKGLVTNDDRIDWTETYNLFHGHVAYVWHGDSAGVAIDVGVNLRSAGFFVRSRVVWVKPAFIFGQGHYHWQHESAWYAVRKSASAKWCGDRKQSTVWEIGSMHVMSGSRGDEDNPVTGHSTQKPVECMARPIRNHGGPDDDVYDPFLGSGTTLIAAEQLGRRCFGMEIAPAYVDVCFKRWENFTGKTAKLDKPPA